MTQGDPGDSLFMSSGGITFPSRGVESDRKGLKQLEASEKICPPFVGRLSLGTVEVLQNSHRICNLGEVFLEGF